MIGSAVQVKQILMVISLLVVSAIGLFYASTQVFERPLAVEIVKMSHDEARVHAARVKRFSTPAIGGMMHFGDHCSGCHGENAEGSATAPSLIDRPFAIDFRDSELFHNTVARAIPEHRALLRRGATGPISFNSIEMMGKYLRELRRADSELPVEIIPSAQELMVR